MIKKIKIPIFHGWLILYQNVNFDDIIKEYDLHELPNGAAMYAAILNDNGFAIYVIAVNDATPDAIAHEAAHVTHAMMLHRGIKPDLNNDEWENYLLAWVVSQCHKYLKIDTESKKHKRKHKPVVKF